MRVEQEKKTGNVESVTLEQVPMEERKSWADVAMIQAGIMICVPSLMLGGILAESMPMSQAIWSGVIGYAEIVGSAGRDDGIYDDIHVILVYRHVLLHLAFLENRDHQS